MTWNTYSTRIGSRVIEFDSGSRSLPFRLFLKFCHLSDSFAMAVKYVSADILASYCYEHQMEKINF